jgi:hypothetical protein
MATGRSKSNAGEGKPTHISDPRGEGGAGAGFEIVARRDFSDVTYLLEIRHPMMARAARPGQFVIVIPHEHGERIPLTIADFDRERGTVTLVVQAAGKTTQEMQRRCRVGCGLFAVTGPLGLPVEIGNAKKVVCVGGGLGVAPIFPLARAFSRGGRCRPERSSGGGRDRRGADAADFGGRLYRDAALHDLQRMHRDQQQAVRL